MSADRIFGSRAFLWLLVILGALTIIVPIYWLVLTAVMPPQFRGAFPLPFIVFSASFDIFSFVFNLGLFDYLTNSIIVAVGTALFCTVIGSLAAYSFAKVRFPLKYIFLMLPLLSRMVPDVGIAVPLIETFHRLGLGDTYTGLILVHSLLALPIVIWIMTSLFEEVPNDLLEAGEIDGCTKLQVFYRIAMPLVAPGISTSMIFCFLISWDELLFSMMLMTTKLTVPAFMSQYISYPQYPYVMAISIFLLIPAFIFTFVFQRYIRTGIMAGAVKG
ncbi:MAG: carbohydrate ABC transporter permease [Candidatus Thermoplasmatota archaeon]|nr:carbohydrate ABC transporter permease [Candidatus Thermoplasmatota archaeon]